MWKLCLACAVLGFATLPMQAGADGVNTGLQDKPVVPIIRESPATGAPLVVGSNTVGRPGIGPDQLYGYDVNIAYDHVAVGVAIVAVLFLMTEWMDAR